MRCLQISWIEGNCGISLSWIWISEKNPKSIKISMDIRGFGNFRPYFKLKVGKGWNFKPRCQQQNKPCTFQHVKIRFHTKNRYFKFIFQLLDSEGKPPHQTKPQVRKEIKKVPRVINFQPYLQTPQMSTERFRIFFFKKTKFLSILYPFSKNWSQDNFSKKNKKTEKKTNVNFYRLTILFMTEWNIRRVN